MRVKNEKALDHRAGFGAGGSPDAPSVRTISAADGEKTVREDVPLVPLAASDAGKQRDVPAAGGDDSYLPLSYSEALKKLKEYPCHPACAKFPLMGEDELTAFAEDIRVRGQQDPIDKFEDKIADGRNRLVACLIAGVPPKFRDVQIEGSVTEWVSSKNINRRHLTSGQRAVIAFDMLPVLKDEAKQRQRRSQGPGRKVAKDSATSGQQGKATEIAAKMLNTNATYVEKVKKIASTALELIDLIRSGAIELEDACNIAPQPFERRQELVQDRTGITTKRKRKKRKSRKSEPGKNKESIDPGPADPAQQKSDTNLGDSADINSAAAPGVNPVVGGQVPPPSENAGEGHTEAPDVSDVSNSLVAAEQSDGAVPFRRLLKTLVEVPLPSTLDAGDLALIDAAINRLEHFTRDLRKHFCQKENLPGDGNGEVGAGQELETRTTGT